jgi:hypothetical protein
MLSPRYSPQSVFEPNRSSWSLRIRGHGDFEDFPAIPVFSGYEKVARTTPGLWAGRHPIGV